MTLTFHTLWMLSGLAAAVFGTFVRSADKPLVAWLSLALGFVLGSVWLGSGRPLDAAWVGGLVAAVAAAQLASPSRSAVVTLAAGVLAAVWASLIHAQGLPQPAALVAGATLSLGSAYLSRRARDFAPPLLQEEALVALLAFGLVVAITPTVSQGWQSAQALNLTDKNATMPLLPAWMVSFAGASTMLGALWSMWRRG